MMNKSDFNINEYIKGKALLPLDEDVGLLISPEVNPNQLDVCILTLIMFRTIDLINNSMDVDEYKKHILSKIEETIDEIIEGKYDVSGKNIS